MALDFLNRNYSKGSTEPPKTPNTYRLFSYQLCPYVERTRLVVAAKELDIQQVNIDLGSKPEWYFLKHKAGKVPALELPDGKILVESIVIAEFLDEAFKGKRQLQPTDVYAKYHQKVLFESFSDLPSCFIRLWKTKDLTAFVEAIESNLKILEDTLANEKTKFIGGNENPMIVDYLIWPWLERMPSMVKYARKDADFDGYVSKKFPLVSAYLKNMLADSGVKKVAYDDAIHEEYFLRHFGFSK